MTEVEVRAAHNVLEACAQTETIDKVVFTSSATAVIWRDDRKSITADFDERHWSDINFCRKFKVPASFIYLFYYVLNLRSPPMNQHCYILK
jgi:nucleoside-diphosphate-sugar epimerase